MNGWLKSLSIGIAAASMTLSGGCADTGPIGGRLDTVANYPEVSLSQASLQDALAFQQPVVTRADNNLMRVTLPVRSKSDETLHVEYRVLWSDATGAPIGPEVSWAPLRLEPRQPTTVVVTSTSDRAAKFNIQFRWGKP